MSGNEWLPVEPFDYAWRVGGPTIGCNQLACSECGVQVRSLLAFDLPADIDAAEVYDLIGKNDSSRFTASATYRIYTCRHYSIVARFKFPVEQQNEYAEWTPWKCAGHPVLSLPARVDGIVLDEQSDFGQLARKSFAGELGVSLHPSVDDVPGFWLARLYRLLGHLPAAAKTAAAAADQLLDAEPRVRMAAISFFDLAGSDAPGAERLAPALRDHPELFVDVVVDGMLMTLERYLIGMLYGRILNKTGDTVALELMRAALSRSFKPVGLDRYLFGMAEVDQKWLLDHADAIVAAVPDLWGSMKSALESAGVSQRQIETLEKRVRLRGVATGGA